MFLPRFCNMFFYGVYHKGQKRVQGACWEEHARSHGTKCHSTLTGRETLSRDKPCSISIGFRKILRLKNLAAMARVLLYIRLRSRLRKDVSLFREMRWLYASQKNNHFIDCKFTLRAISFRNSFAFNIFGIQNNGGIKK